MRGVVAAGSVLVGGIAGGATASAIGRRSGEGELSNSVKWSAQGGFGVGGMAGIAGLALVRQRPALGTALLGVGAFGMGLGLTACALEADRFNSVDPGVNALEQDDFSRAHERRLWLVPAIGAGIGAVAIAGLTAAQPAWRTPGRLAIGAAIGTALGGTFGLVGAAVGTASGQDSAYAPSTREPGAIARTLLTQNGATEDTASTGLRIAPGAATKDLEDAPLRTSGSARDARFYALADGSGDGVLTAAELEAHVRTFDADGDSAISQSEWETLRAAILAP